MNSINIISLLCIALNCVLAKDFMTKIGSENLSKNEVIELLAKHDDGFRVPFLRPKDFIENRYLIAFHNESDMKDVVKLLSGKKFSFDTSFAILRQYNFIATIHVKMSDFTVNLFRQMKQVRYIEHDAKVKAFDNGQRCFLCEHCVNQSDAKWCLSAVSDIDYNDTFEHSKYKQGFGVFIAVIDTGVTHHPDLRGRVIDGKNCISDSVTQTDDNGHGTGCASMAAGTTAGVAKHAFVVGVKVLDGEGSGSFSQVICGIDWVTAQAKSWLHRCVISMSLGGGFSQTVNDAIQRAVDAGCFVAVAAGNSAEDACGTSPASSPVAYTVAAASPAKQLASFSNFGPCTNIISPGVDCKLAKNSTLDEFWTASGTSMATPLVAGVAAVQKGINPSLTPSQMAALLDETSLKNEITGDLQGTPNQFINLDCSKVVNSK